ncbi:MAG: 30S ribosomal protein S4e [Candidatus Lokiarchaeota archaeon]|nr:30S ribosomal protein S4e [Candidatus Lokiarchaeota archaeon]
MGSKGNKRHTKRLNTTKYIHIDKKHPKFFINTRSGPHQKHNSLPLGHILRDLLKVVNTLKEAKKVINQGKVLIDGRVCKDVRFPVGLMDVVEILDYDKVYRILPKKIFGLYPLEIPKKEKDFKLCRIENKSTVKGGHVQLNLHDGRNILIKVKDPKKPKEDKYNTMGVLKIKLPSQEILDYYPLEENASIMVIRGKNLGMVGNINSITKRYGPNASIVKITANSEGGDEEIHETAYAYSFIIGKKKPEIKLFSD